MYRDAHRGEARERLRQQQREYLETQDQERRISELRERIRESQGPDYECLASLVPVVSGALSLGECGALRAAGLDFDRYEGTVHEATAVTMKPKVVDIPARKSKPVAERKTTSPSLATTQFGREQPGGGSSSANIPRAATTSTSTSAGQDNAPAPAPAININIISTRCTLHASDDATQYAPLPLNIHIHHLLTRKRDAALIARGCLRERVEIINYRCTNAKQARVSVSVKTKSSPRSAAPAKLTLKPNIGAQPVKHDLSAGPTHLGFSSLPSSSRSSRCARQVAEEQDGFILVDEGDLTGGFVPAVENGTRRFGWLGWWTK